MADLENAAGNAAYLMPAEGIRRRARRAVVRRRLAGGLVAVAVLGGAAVAALRLAPDGVPVAAVPSTSPSTAAQSAPAETATGTPSAATPSATGSTSTPPDCPLAQLRITVGAGQGGVGHSSAPLVFRNLGAATCRLHGYPGVAALDAKDSQIAQAKRTPKGYMGGLSTSNGTPPVVDLAPGQAASALVETLNANPDGTACVAYAALLVTPPNETHSLKIQWGTTTGCANLEVHPVVPGETGRATG